MNEVVEKWLNSYMKQISDMLQRTIDKKEELIGHLERYITS
jgi:hypothetical protein